MVRIELYEKVFIMRQAQRKYFKTRLKKDRDEAYVIEKQIDEFVKQRKKDRIKIDFPEIKENGMEIYKQPVIEVKGVVNYTKIFIRLGYNVVYKDNGARTYKIYNDQGEVVSFFGHDKAKDFLKELGFELIIKK